MIFTISELCNLLREAVNVQNEGAEIQDPAFLTMTDEDLTMFLKLGMSKVYPSVEDLADLPPGSDYPVILVSKKELYLKLAVVSAPLYDLTADNNNQIKRSQRFSHYMALAESAQAEYEDWVENGGGATVDPNTGIQGVTTYEVLRSKNHYSLRNYEHGLSPVVRVKIGEITTESVAFSWSSFNNDHFGKYLVYVSENPIVDPFRDGSKAEDKILDGATLVLSTWDFRNNHKRVEGLKPETEYYIAVFSIERNQLYGYKQVTFQTLPVLTGEEISVDSLGGEQNG